MITEQAQVGRGLWLRWVLASTMVLVVGLPVGFVVAAVVGGAMGSAVGGAVLGASVGIAQWLILRREVSRAGWWVLASTVTVGFAVGAAGAVLDEGVGSALGGVVLGASVGIAQWLILRREVSRAGWWVLASTVGFVVAAALSLPALKKMGGGLLGGAFEIVDFVGLVLSLALYGAITGGVLVWLLRQPASKYIGSEQAAE